MKLTTIAAAALVAASAILPAATASAQRVVHRERTVVHQERNVRHWGGHRRTVCKWQVRNHHRTRVCRTVRY